jgi:hypothetical protein
LQNWRAAVLLAGLLCATLSTTLDVYLYVHALYTGGYPFYHPIELMCIRLGTLAALLGIVAAIVGKGRGRIPLAVISILNLMLWFAAAMAQWHSERSLLDTRSQWTVSRVTGHWELAGRHMSGFGVNQAQAEYVVIIPVRESYFWELPVAPVEVAAGYSRYCRAANNRYVKSTG